MHAREFLLESMLEQLASMLGYSRAERARLSALFPPSDFTDRIARKVGLDYVAGSAVEMDAVTREILKEHLGGGKRVDVLVDGAGI